MTTGALCAALILLATAPAASDDLKHDHGAWLMWLAQGSFSGATQGSDASGLVWWFDGHARFFDRTNGYGQSILRPAIGWAFNGQLTAHVGYGWIRSSAPGTPDVDEHRVFQQVIWKPQIDGLGVLSRTRLEQRFVETGDDVGWRLRQFVKVTWPLPFAERLALAAYDEIFFALNDTDWGARGGFDQNRLFLGPQWRFDRAGRIRGEVGYLNRITRRRGPDVMDHLVSINLLTSF